jgi:hypothetical protein
MRKSPWPSSGVYPFARWRSTLRAVVADEQRQAGERELRFGDRRRFGFHLPAAVPARSCSLGPVRGEPGEQVAELERVRHVELAPSSCEAESASSRLPRRTTARLNRRRERLAPSRTHVRKHRSFSAISR